ncbi:MULTISPECIES: lipoyl(octanoyl) transferase LipB [unclassified Shewanella]|uniref:lipoyl(octanoyl) transferase LipB n=1 Tax=unclassified Shewanella TaxID=196818 RepID=UPI0009714B4B|nr:MULTISPECIES: lipoyl(octanoyl) transferase LipB [unclassified Shewanella]MDO6619839.1 lipoyl(octanoyl) transferase LipB [Shewanella sp. 6_MG-2023]MDO6638922.1 lipoyl(octanoyl) transferase LipB [Shewanella sp. 5_MG-2023]MDO6676947.1 lipoyl(octanoyl) transferase LipB [Shewanella sp. 4_MG-2023]MDO6773995.1 lipoyl(octanoyl) transferase LipB [Shewanella sp. 3_MG-2023]PMG27640.1 octanoyltransferase [Shewanella sp. 10N.286.52.C2]
MQTQTLHIRHLGRQDYESVWHAMQSYTDNRDSDSNDELWIVEHSPVFTQGQAGKSEHILNPGDIPVIQVDRGGQVTYHGPGQLVVYPLIDIKRSKLGVRQLVNNIEQSIVDMLAMYDVNAYAKADAPGVYVDERKLASLGLRIRKGCSFHGLALNVDMDLAPFLRINPCGYAGLEMVQCKALGGPQTVTEAGDKLIQTLSQVLGYQELVHHQGLAE